jgi:hypothetical protein
MSAADVISEQRAGREIRRTARFAVEDVLELTENGTGRA